MQKGFGLKQETSAKCPVHSEGIKDSLEVQGPFAVASVPLHL